MRRAGAAHQTRRASAPSSRRAQRFDQRRATAVRRRDRRRSGTAARPAPSERREKTLGTVAALILAAGGGRRYGGPKALVAHEGTLLLDRAVSVARQAGCEPVVVVLGAEADTVRTRVDLSGVRTVLNSSWRTGTGSALREGLAALADTEAPATVVLLVDTPGVTADAVSRVVKDADEATLRTATYRGQRGYPVLLGRSHWAGVAVLAAADVGARAYLLAHAAEVVAVACDDIADGAEYRPPEPSADPPG